MTESGQKITFDDGKLNVPDQPIIPFIEGDGIGPDIWAASVRVFDAAVEKSYSGQKRIVWKEILAGEKANEETGEWLPQDSVDAISDYLVAIKGPLTTPVGGGIRSLNVSLRQLLDLYACVRPVKWIRGVPSPVKNPEKLDIVIFRENTEDVYAGIEWIGGSEEADRIREFINSNFNKNIRENSGIGIKPISPFGTKRLIRKAVDHAIAHNRGTVTLMHKGNIMKFTEGSFRDWGYELASEEFGDSVISEEALWENHDGQVPEGRLVMRDRIADSMFQQILLRPDEYDVIATPNLNGDYISDAAAAQVAGRLDMLIFLPIFSIAGGLTTLVGMFYGAREIEALKSIVKYGISRSFFITVCSSAFVYFFAPAFSALFTQDKEIIEVSVGFLRLMTLVYPFVAIAISCGRVMQGLGKGIPVLVITTVRVLGISAPLALYFSFVLHKSVEWNWYAMMISTSIAFTIAVTWVQVELKKLTSINHPV